jgi:hypothetical protein
MADSQKPPEHPTKVVWRPDPVWWDEMRFDRSHVPPGLRWVRFRRPRREQPAKILVFPGGAFETDTHPGAGRAREAVGGREEGC